MLLPITKHYPVTLFFNNSISILRSCDNSNLTRLPTDLIRKTLYGVVEDILNTSSFEIRVKSGAKKGTNFNSIVYRINFWPLDDDTDIRNGKLYLKLAPENEARRMQFNTRKLFLREIYLYEKVLPYFRRFQESRNIIVDEEGFCEYPKCYKSITIEPECLFLEDMESEGFRMVQFGKDEVTFEHARLVMQVLARFHATSLALKHNYRGKFEEIASKLDDPFLRRSGVSELRNFYNFSAKVVLDAVTAEEDANILKRLLTLYERDQYDIAVDCVDSSAAEPYSVIGHGDCWANNVLYQHNDKDHPVLACFIDWQIARYASPVLDIVYYLFNCTTKELRDKYYDSLLKIYHETLSYQILRLGSDPEKLFPYSALLEQLKRFGKFGLTSASVLLPILLSENCVNINAIAEDMEKGKTKGGESYISDTAKRRIREVVIDMIQLGYI